MRRLRSMLTMVLVAAVLAGVPAGAEERTVQPIARSIHAHAARLAGQPGSRVPATNAARTGRSVAKGAVIGFGVGAVLASTIGQEACLDSPRWHCAVGGGVLFGLIGGAIAWLMK